VAQYAWSTSPLRRYVDLVNQWQLLACVQHGVAAKLVAPFKPKDADLFAVVQGFDETYTAYADYQRRMEYFWCLRWLVQEGRREVPAAVVKGDLVRLEDVPLLLHVPGLGVHARGTRVLLEVMSVDELTIEASVRTLRVLDAPTVAGGAAADEADDEGDGEGRTGEGDVEAEAADGPAQGEAGAEAAVDADAVDAAAGDRDADHAAGGDVRLSAHDAQQAAQADPADTAADGAARQQMMEPGQ
jgi:exoribonuclease-2